MMDFSQAVLEKIVLHGVGNKLKEEPLRLSRSELEPAQAINDLLLRYFLSPFGGEVFYQLAHEEALEENPIHAASSRVFDDPSSFYLASLEIARHLFEQSNHHKIKGGELYVVLLRRCVVEGELVDALGIFKSENKETFLKIMPKSEGYAVDADSGININRLDKGCLIFNTEREQGYKLAVVDRLNKVEAQYWRDLFLKVEQREDAYFQTHSYLDVCRSFVDKVFNDQNQVSRPDQIELLNRSMDYFNEHSTFEEPGFLKKVMPADDVSAAFEEFKHEYQAQRELALPLEFPVSKQAVQKSKRKFKSVLKLDKNFHVYIHGDRSRVLRGRDEETGLNFYQLFFENES